MEIKVDTESATVTLDGKATYGAQELLALICKLGQCREQIGPLGVNPIGLSFARAENPATHIEPDQDHFTIAFEHPWFSWTGMSLTRDETLRLAAMLFQTANVISTSAGLVIGPELGKPYGRAN